MKRLLLILCWMFVLFTGAFLRFDDLAKRPFHADEATGARITARRMEHEGGKFDPKHYHGPVLHMLGALSCKARGENGWVEMTKSTLRLPVAVAGVLLLGVPILFRRRLGDVPALLASAFLATSPLLVYYSRMFIHESLLVLFGMLVLAALAGTRLVAAGVLIGLMFATKESFAISMIAWTGAGLLVLFENRQSLDRAAVADAWRRYRGPAAVMMAASLLTSMLFYTEGFRHLQGAVDAVRTFFVYETVQGHDKPINYYADLLVLPQKSAGLWWFGTPIAVLAIAAYATTFFAKEGRNTIRFVAYAAAGHFLVYGLIAYKTPWLACLPWAHVCLLAGFSFTAFSMRPIPVRSVLVMFAVAAVITQFIQTRRACGRLAADARNPFAYVPTRGEVEKLEPWLRELATVAPDGRLEPFAVVGTDYWPLPWYLRSFREVGYLSALDSRCKDMLLVITLPDATEEAARMLAETHMPLPRGLRSDVPIHLFVRVDLWKRWMEDAGR